MAKPHTKSAHKRKFGGALGLGELESFGQRAKLLSQKLRNCNGLVKSISAGGTRPGKVFCGAAFACKEKQFKTVYRHHGQGRRRYQICTLQGTCNQQTCESVFYEVS
jgi:hypothetical protein